MAQGNLHIERFARNIFCHGTSVDE